MNVAVRAWRVKATGLVVTLMVTAERGAFGAPAPVSQDSTPPIADYASVLAPFHGVGNPTPAVWTIEPNGGQSQPFSVAFTGFGATNTPEGYLLFLPGQAARREPGRPDLPAAAELVSGRPGASVHVVLTPPAWIEIAGISVAPTEQRVMDDVTTNRPTYRMVRSPAPSIYGEDRFWPDPVVTVQTAWMGTNKIVRAECVPVQYNPVRHVIRYATVLEGTLVFEASSDPQDR